LNFDQPVEDSLWINYSWESLGLFYYDSVLFRSADKKQLKIKWEFMLNEVPTILTVNFNWKGKQWVFQEHFPMDVYHPAGGISVWKAKSPWFQDWLIVNDSIMIQNDSSEVTYVYYYSHSFDPSRAPMAMRPGPGNASLSIDSIFTLAPNRYFSPTKDGLYFFQSDSNTTSGRSILVKNEPYPQPKEIHQLTQPLIYITTRVEFLKLKKDLTDKQALDKFWLSTLGSPEKARTAIKAFYQNVEISNRLFSSYKEGWKTDRGLIYTVMGAPLAVNKMNDGETWIYQDVAGNELNFSFLKIRNIFSNNHYELIRDPSYDRTWFQAIDRWREGRIN
jgi:GWxTD domain-containing protein